MQNLTKLIREKRKKNSTNKDILNLIREYLQVLILKSIYQSKFGPSLSFTGGTCLRMCYNLKRYSEDLDFTLDNKNQNYSFGKLNETIKSNLKNTDFEVDINIKEEKTVQTSMIRIKNVLHIFEVSDLKSQKLHIKLEIDTNPVKISKKQRETFFLTKFNEIFPIIKHTNEVLFAGKMSALLTRPYTKGRDFYDLIWYLKEKTNLNLKYLNNRLKQEKLTPLKTEKKAFEKIKKLVEKTNTGKIIKDLEPFIENQEELIWLKDYKKVFEQLIGNNQEYEILKSSQEAKKGKNITKKITPKEAIDHLKKRR